VSVQPHTAWASLVLAPNPGPMTLEGTNTWILGAPGGRQCVVVDPGPADQTHLQAVLAHATTGGSEVAAVVLTHAHPDHAEGAASFARLADAPLLAPDPGAHADEEWRAVVGRLQVDQPMRLGDVDLLVVAAPGHTSDSVAILVVEDSSLLTGDTVLGRGWTVVAHPDGRLADYLATLDRLDRLVAGGSVTRFLPGHGPVVADPAARLAAYRSHRRQRLDQVRAARAAGAQTARDVVERVYADVPHELWPAAELSVRAQLAYLEPADLEPA
jgi:glyoxylase-like metal-dependent hydrolase (beta-lactamase superfamily II)